jgi:hypothetical protein
VDGDDALEELRQTGGDEGEGGRGSERCGHEKSFLD